MRRRLMLKSSTGVSPVLPAEYQQVEWIGNNSHSCIILPSMIFTENSVVKCKFRKSLQANQEEALIMAQFDDRTKIEIGFLKNSRLFAFSAGGTSSTIADASIYGPWVDYTAVFQSATPTKKATAIVNGTVINGSDGSGVNNTGSAPCALFRNPISDTLNCVAEIASFTIVLEGGLSINLIPCYRKADNVIGMYDTISSTFFANAGTGTFTKGADI